MKKTIFAAILAFLLYTAFKLIISLTDLSIVVEPENFLMLGIALAFCWSALLYVSGNINFAIGVNIAWFSIALSALISNIAEESYLFWFYFFFFVFPLGFLVKYLFFSKELEEKLFIQISCLAILLFLSAANVYLMLNF